jgi:predicted DNA-binding transcriptional regulator AlpA
MTRPLARKAPVEPEAAPNGRRVDAPVERLALRFDEVAASIGVSRRLLERELSAGRFPRPDLKIGRCPVWRIATINAWLGGSGEQ